MLLERQVEKQVREMGKNKIIVDGLHKLRRLRGVLGSFLQKNLIVLQGI